MEAARLLAILDHIALDLHFRVTLMDEQCHELHTSLRMCTKTPLEDESKQSTDEVAMEDKYVEAEIQGAETALQEALARARAIREAQSTRAKKKPEPVTKHLSPPPPAKSTVAPERKLQVPRSLRTAMTNITETQEAWMSPDTTPPGTFLSKLSHMLSQRDSPTSVAPIRLAYREQIFRLQHAYARILQVLHTKCSTADADAPPTLSRVFPLWFRLHKIKSLLGELNQELSCLVQRTPPPPRLSETTMQRSAAFLGAIKPTRRRPPTDSVDNFRLVEAVQAVDTKWDAFVMGRVYESLQGGWNDGTYADALHRISLEEVCRHVVPSLQERLHAQPVTKSDATDALMLLRLLHSITCCDGVMMRSFVPGQRQ
ncbi:Aste57867_2641 [Aphanomyces stellatus]|uniref:Aste57867_2641 protein n=1 Tax=Aphanomyces stellatus TaxID=120398 RepID=A0A485K948_9STRA|nr:hypothetical protein As57867_002634 [Aphanomyces stellatus]VFT79837.1 Aste57867_2641 [Aphanomyces stellatus]